MSHFAVCVLIPSLSGDDVDKMLAPFQENNMGDCPKQFMEFIEDEEYNLDPETGKHGRWENPHAKWDWYQIGGRASGMLPLKAGGSTSVAQIKDIEFGAIEARVKAAERFWEIAVEGAELLPGEEKPFLWRTPEYYIKQFGSKDNYVRCNSRVYPWAFISPDGEWHERGEMGWFACSDATGESTTDFMDLWDKTIAEADPELYVVVVDCHI